MLRRTSNAFVGFLFGLFPSIFVVGVALFAFQASMDVIIILIFSVLEIGAIWLGYRIYSQIQIVGPIEFLSLSSATPDADRPEADEYSDHKRRSPSEYVDLVSRSAHLCKGGTLRLFGDWFGASYRNPLRITKAEYDDQSEKLVIRFHGGEKLTIKKPKHIFEAGTYLKVLEAEYVEMTGFSSDLKKSSMVLTYLKFWIEGRRLKSLTSAPDKRIRFDLSLSAPALMIFGDPNNLRGIGLGTNGDLEEVMGNLG